MRVLVKIDRKTLKRNPDHGKFYPGDAPVDMIPGSVSVSPDGRSSSRVVTPIFEMPHTDTREYLFDYADDPIKCSRCGKEFHRNEVKTIDSEEWDEDTESYLKIEVCPFCEEHLEFVFEEP